MEEAVCHYELTVHVAEVEGRHTAVDCGLEEFVLEGSRRLGRCGSGVGYFNMVEHHFLGVVTADDAAPVCSLLCVGGEGDRLLRRSHAIEVAKDNYFHRHLNSRLASDCHARLDIERGADRNLHTLRQGGVLGPNEGAYWIFCHCCL